MRTSFRRKSVKNEDRPPTFEHHSRVNAWWSGRVRRLSNHRVGLPAGRLCAGLHDGRRPCGPRGVPSEAVAFIPCDRRILDSPAITAPRKTTDIYLADLAAARGWILATLDEGISHPAADLIPELPAQP